MKNEHLSVGDFIIVTETGEIGKVMEIFDEEIGVIFLERELADETYWAWMLQDDIELLAPYVLSSDEARRIVRFEYDESESAPEGNVFGNCICEDGYNANMEDIHEAFTNMEKAGINISTFCKWYNATTSLLHSVGLELASWDTVYETLDMEELITYVLQECREICEEDYPGYGYDIGSFISEMADMTGRLLIEKELPIEEKWLPEKLETQIADKFDSDSIDKASEKAQKVFKVCLERLCDRNYPEFLQRKGYCIYCGTKIYPQNWPQARDIFIKYYELTGDASAANTLGYIFYYGRCTGGVPEYDKAFKYFSIGHAYGYFESTYKLADMFSHGYGVVKSPETAFRLYNDVYQQNKKRFIAGDYTCKFADAALRMGNCYLKGIGTVENPRTAYMYYLAAELAIKKRIEDANHYGDNVVYSGIKKALKEARAAFDDKRRVITYDHEVFFLMATSPSGCARLTWKYLASGAVSITLKPVPDEHAFPARYMLVTFPSADYCELLEKITIKTNIGADILTVNNHEVIFNRAEWAENDVLHLYLYDNVVASIRADSFTYTVPSKRREKASGKLLSFATIRFGAEGRTYDYLTDIENLQVGERVIVSGYEGETEVEVVDVYKQYESETELPIERYKKVIRRADKK